MRVQHLLRCKAARNRRSRPAVDKHHLMVMPSRHHLQMKEEDPLHIHQHLKAKIMHKVLNKHLFTALIIMNSTHLGLRALQIEAKRISCWINFRPLEFHVDVPRYRKTTNNNNTQAVSADSKMGINLQKHKSYPTNKCI